MTVDVVEEAKRIMARERVLIDAARAPGFNMAKMKEAGKGNLANRIEVVSARA